MGCTSSAPSMDGYISDSYSASVKNENTRNDAELKKEPSSKDMKLVLPSCDNLEKNLELASQNSIRNGGSSDEPKVETVKTSSSINKLNENHDQMSQHENDKHGISNDVKNQNEEHYATLREVVDKVLEDKTILQDQPSDDGEIEDDYDYDDKYEAKSFVDSDPPSEVEVEVVKVQEEPENLSEESKSPSQSECGRATRWEALADIAAELPPTLAVDPITGQIYSLAK